MNKNTAFLHRKIERERKLYVQRSPGFETNGRIFKLIKSIKID